MRRRQRVLLQIGGSPGVVIALDEQLAELIERQTFELAIGLPFEQLENFLVAANRIVELLRAMKSLGLPKVMVSVISFMYRYIFVLVDEAMRLSMARDSRSADPDGQGGGTLLWRAQVLGGMIGTLFLRSYERSERIYAAMLSRGFTGEIHTLKDTSLQQKDVITLAAFLTLLVAIEVMAHIYW